jgi:hypothetical protein
MAESTSSNWLGYAYISQGHRNRIALPQLTKSEKKL